MAAPLRIEERLSLLEARMTALEQLQGRIDRLASELRGEIRAGDETLREEMRTGHVMIVTALTEQIEESWRHTRVLFEEALSRIAAVSEGLKAQGHATASLARNLAAVAVNLDESRTETRAMFDTLVRV